MKDNETIIIANMIGDKNDIKTIMLNGCDNFNGTADVNIGSRGTNVFWFGSDVGGSEFI